MKVSIITATYNSEKTIKDTILSLESQDYDDIEFIIIDGGSKDNTLAVAQEHSSRISKIISEPDKGIYDALNKGILHSTGDIVGFLHSDDVFTYPSAVSDIVNSFSNNNVDAVYSDLNYVSQKNMNKVVRKWHSGVFDIRKLKFGWMPPHPTFYMKKKKYDEWGAFDISYRISADYDSLLRYLYVHKASVFYLPKVLISMRVGGESNRSLSNIIKKSKEDIDVIKKNGLFWPVVLICKNLSKLPQFIK